MSDFDIEDFRVRGLVLPKQQRSRRTRRVSRGGRFVPGPIPIELLRAFRLPAAFKVWAVLHTRERMGFSPRLARDFMHTFGLSKRMAQRGLAELERLGLARVHRHPGRAAEIELLLPADDEPGEGAA